MLRDATPYDASRIARLLVANQPQWCPTPDDPIDELGMMSWVMHVLAHGKVGVFDEDGRITASIALMPFLTPWGGPVRLLTEWVVFGRRGATEAHRGFVLQYLEGVAADAKCPIMVHIPARTDPAGLASWASLEGYSKVATVLMR